MNELENIYCKEEKITGEITVIFQAQEESSFNNKFLGPVPVFWFLFILILIISVFDLRKGNKSFIVDKIIFSIAGLMGILFIFLWLGTDHWTLSKNMNLIWAIPLHLPVILMLRKLNKRFIKYYFLITAVIAGLLLFAWNLIPQNFPPAVIPISLIIFIRSARIYFKR